jgi:hypothetical protein
MTDLEKELNQEGSALDPGNARKRKLKRGGAEVSNRSMTESSHRKPERRASTHAGSTIRERLVAANVKLPPNPLPNLQDKLNLNLLPGSRMEIMLVGFISNRHSWSMLFINALAPRALCSSLSFDLVR